MNDAQFEFWIIAVALVWFASTAGLVWVTWRIGKTCDDRHTRRICDCDVANGPDEWSATSGLCEPGDCDACDTWRAKMDWERT